MLIHWSALGLKLSISPPVATQIKLSICSNGTPVNIYRHTAKSSC